jgi:branched-chain amino acid transport system substrate-binding protein
MAVGGYDGMAAIVHAIRATKGKVDGEAAVKSLLGWKFASPRGPIMINPDTRDIVMNEYLSEVIMKDGRLYQNTLDTIQNVRDPCRELKVAPCK